MEEPENIPEYDSDYDLDYYFKPFPLVSLHSFELQRMSSLFPNDYSELPNLHFAFIENRHNYFEEILHHKGVFFRTRLNKREALEFLKNNFNSKEGQFLLDDNIMIEVCNCTCENCASFFGSFAFKFFDKQKPTNKYPFFDFYPFALTFRFHRGNIIAMTFCCKTKSTNDFELLSRSN